MGVSVFSITGQSVVLRAPLAPNINHRETAFGGSVSALAILAAWCLLHTRLRTAGDDSRIVIQRNSMEYLQPLTGDFYAIAESPDDLQWELFLRTLDRRGRARIALSAAVEVQEQPCARLMGEFVALRAGS